MCLFPSGSPPINSAAYKAGIEYFKCGACPECLRDRANSWALRSYYECKDHVYNCMVCLTYDSYIRDEQGRIIGENVSDLSVNKRDIQLFIKRLRKWQSSFTDEKIKYLVCAEYGSRTHRPHYHALLFGVRFPDCVPYKKSKRGNLIYTSHILNKLWSHGICTVDSLNVTSACARYCTKYVAKSRSDNTFMLASQSVGLQGLLRDFNGYSYFVEGREYPIPRRVWNEVIMNDYAGTFVKLYEGTPFEMDVLPDYRYVNFDHDSWDNSRAYFSRYSRAAYRFLRDSDERYSSYVRYWKFKGELYARLRPSVYERIASLDSSKYHNYKIAALKTLSKRKLGVPAMGPGESFKSYYGRYLFEQRIPLPKPLVTCPISPCLNRASDTGLKRITRKQLNILKKEGRLPRKGLVFLQYPLDFSPFLL